jgi:hypothetical protein
MTTEIKPALVSINGLLRPTLFHFQIVVAYPGNSTYGTVVFFKDPSDATLELLQYLSVWGGPTKNYEMKDKTLVKGWEFSKQSIMMMEHIRQKTQSYRPKDLYDCYGTNLI